MYGFTTHTLMVQGKPLNAFVSEMYQPAREAREVAETFYEALIQRDLLLTDIQPPVTHPEIVRGLMECLQQHIAWLHEGFHEAKFWIPRDSLHEAWYAPVNRTDRGEYFLREWGRYGNQKRYGEQILTQLEAYLKERAPLFYHRLRTYGTRWKRLLLALMLEEAATYEGLRNQLTMLNSRSYADQVEQYLTVPNAWHEAQWWDMPDHAYNSDEWRAMGYVPQPPATTRKAGSRGWQRAARRQYQATPAGAWVPALPQYTYGGTGSEPPEKLVVYAPWQVNPKNTEEGAELRSIFWNDRILEDIPRLAAAFHAAYPGASDEMIQDWSQIISGEYGHQYFDWWGNAIPLCAPNVLRLNFARDVYQLQGRDFAAYPYRDF